MDHRCSQLVGCDHHHMWLGLACPQHGYNKDEYAATICVQHYSMNWLEADKHIHTANTKVLMFSHAHDG